METTKSVNVHNLIIVDESGSMHSIYDETLSSLNQTLDGIRRTQKENPDQHQYVTLVTFEGEGTHGVKCRYDRKPIEKIGHLTTKDYEPLGCTPLFDAMGLSINKLRKNIKDNDAVLVTIITDGYENSSRKYSGAAIKELVATQKAKGWTFAYIGANQDAIEVAQSMNIDNALNFDATPEGTVKMSVLYEKARDQFITNIKYQMACRSDLSDAFTPVSDLFMVEDDD